MRPPDRRPIYEWAAENIELPAAYAMPGGFRVDPSRYMIAPLDAIKNDRIRQISCYGAIQTGKSLIVEVSIPWLLANAPGPVMWTMQSDDDAKEHAKSRFNALLRSCRQVRDILPRERHDATQTEIYFGGFFLLLNGANLNNLQSKSIRWKFNSEVWLWGQGLLEHAAGRVSKFEETQSSKIFNESQGGTAGDDMDLAWQAGDQSVWSVRCAGCGHLIPLEFFARCETEPERFAGIVWDSDAKREDGTHDIGWAADSARWKCKRCGHEHANTAKTRAAWNASGEYVATNPTAPEAIRSFRWNALVSRDFGALVSQWLAASELKKRGVLQAVKDFHQKRLAMPWKEDEETEKIALTGAGYALADVHAKPADKIANEVSRIMTIDRQRDHWWVLVRAWRADGSSRLLYYSKAITVEQIHEIERLFAVQKQLVFQDAQHDPGAVYADAIRFGWTAIHGSGENSFTHILKSGKKVSRFFSPLKFANVPGGLAPYVHFASDPVKDILHRLRIGKGAQWETPDDPPKEYADQINGDQKRERINKRTGRAEWRWKKVGENHAWDCEGMQIAAALMLRILAAPEVEDTEEKPAG